MHRQIAGRLTSPVTKWIVLVAWVVVLGVAGGFAQKLTDVQDNEASSWLPASAESTRALDELQPFQDPNDIPTVVVYHRASGLTDQDLSAITAQLPQIQAMKGVTGQVSGPTVSRDGQVAQVMVTYNFGKNGWNDLPDTKDALTRITEVSGVDVLVAGQGGQAADSASAFAGIDGTLLFATLGVVILILLFTYRSPVLWLLPIISAVVALMTSEAVVYFLAKDFGLTVNGQSQGILTVLVVGAGTDYALLLVARYREELRRHEDRHEAMAFALHRASPAIMASAATVAVGMLCLSLAEMNSTAGLGPVLAVGVAVTLLVMITLLPALLVIVGRWIFGPTPTGRGKWVKIGVGQFVGGVAAVVTGAILTPHDEPLGAVGAILSAVGSFFAFIGVLFVIQAAIESWTNMHSRPEFGSAEPTATGLWARVGSRIAPRPRQVWVGTAVVLLIACAGMFKLDTNGLSSSEQYTKTFDSVKGQQLLEAHGMVDTSSPIMIVTKADQLQAVADAVRTVPGVGTPVTNIPPVDGTALLVVPVDGDPAAQAAFDEVKALRAAVHEVDGADALVGGTSAIFLDVQTASHRDNLVIIPVVLVVVTLILMLLLRAVVSPLLLIGTVILSFGAALGLSTILFHGLFTHLFQAGDGFRHADASFPLFVFTFLVALGIDYNIFLMTRVREETQTRGTREGSLVALRATGGVITSAGLVLAATFAVLGTLPLVFLAELGTAVALGVILDTMVVRSVLVTALNLDLGGAIWWPSRLDRGADAIEPAGATAERSPAEV